MATWFVNSAATGTGAGTSWANATTTIAAAITLSAAGDDFNVASTHAETQASALTLTFKGTAASPNRIFSCDTTNAPAQASDLLAGASISTTGAFTIALGGMFYCYGVKFSAGSSSSAASIILVLNSTNAQVFDTCTLVLNNTATASRITASNAIAANELRLINTTMTFGNASQGINTAGICRIFWSDTASAILGTAPTVLFVAGGFDYIGRLQGVDLSALGSGHTIIGAISAVSNFVIQNCKLGSSVTVASTPGSQGAGNVDLVSSDSSTAASRAERYWYQGTLTTEATIIRSGGAPQSWKVVTTANAKRIMPFECFECIIECTAGTPITVYGNSVTDLAVNATALTNADLWIEAQVMDSSATPISDLYTTAPATQLTAGTTLTSGTSSGSWTTTGMTTPDARTQSLTFTPQISGYARITYKVARASLTTLRVDPGINV